MHKIRYRAAQLYWPNWWQFWPMINVYDNDIILSWLIIQVWLVRDHGHQL